MDVSGRCGFDIFMTQQVGHAGEVLGGFDKVGSSSMAQVIGGKNGELGFAARGLQGAPMVVLSEDEP